VHLLTSCRTGHFGTLDYIYSTLADLGDYYTVSNQTFHASLGRVYSYRLVIGHAAPRGYYSPMQLTPPTPNNDVIRGNLTVVDNDGCHQSDYPATVKGNVALIMRGTCSFGQKSILAGRAGAIAAVIWFPGYMSPSGTLGTPDKDQVPTFGVSEADVKQYFEPLKKGKVIDVSAYIDGFVVNTPTVNIMAQTKGGDQDNCVMLGGHSDSVTAGPGINDDGSGTLTLLEVATQLAKYGVNNCVRFAWWSAEEEGLLGSDYYVSQLSDEESMKIRLFMDYDMLASPNYAYQVCSFFMIPSIPDC
jgi:aminopeptidase Y